MYSVYVVRKNCTENILAFFELFKGPMELIVTLKNGSLKNALEHKEVEIDGIYNLGPDLNNTNGKPYWLQENGKIAIWNNPDFNNWIFGPKESIGSNRYYGLSSSSEKSTGPYDAKWTYSPGMLYGKWNVTDLKIEFDMLEKVDAISIGKFM